LLFQAWQILVELEQAESQTPCPRCGLPNPATERICAACGATLVWAVEEAPSTPAPVVAEGPAHLQRILAACQEAEAGRMELDEFSSILAWAEQVLKSADLGLARLPGEGELTPEAREAMSDLRQGMADFREALGELHEFARDGRPVHLTAGTRLLVQACDRLAEVQGRARVN
jgi:hypothetical protein